MRTWPLLALALAAAWPAVAQAEPWYALIPPLSDGHVDARAPLAQWEQVRAFDSAEECEKLTMAYARQFAEQTDNAARARYRQVQYVRCVSVSDPRLREERK